MCVQLQLGDGALFYCCLLRKQAERFLVFYEPETPPV